MKNIFVDQIVAEIKNEIKSNRYITSNIKFNDLKTYSDSLDAVNMYWKVDMYPKVSGGLLKRFIKKIIRKIVRPSFFGQMKKQENFNLNVAVVLSETEKRIRELENKIIELEKR